ncbi:MAG: YybH family protein [Actinomycetota bacterium]
MAQHEAGAGVRLENLQEGPGLFERLFNDGNLDGLTSLYEPDAVLVHEPDPQAVGTAAICDALARLLRGNPAFTINRRSAQRSGDLVLAIYDWTRTGTGPDGDVRDTGGRGAIVLRRQPDGAWLVVLDNLTACG